MNSESTNRLRSLVRQLGGPSFVARQLKVSVSTLHGWIKQGKIPSLQKQLELVELRKRLQEVLK
ncbi:hypothetical protein [Candidatus Igneacidithiobacillus taiwanensis]|uniref:hypothetical protein n=1 Tax=Candidatus Igneacidithiobacillus taiwanensis TaxID=1945924 RepID=UPI0028A13F03|nr:hypothetical protein [Candidatus Igneacidithiobacillus taiwanensis]